MASVPIIIIMWGFSFQQLSAELVGLEGKYCDWCRACGDRGMSYVTLIMELLHEEPS